MKGIHTCLWFESQAEDAARFYTSVFKHSKLGTITHYGSAAAEASGRPKGSVMTANFKIGDHEFMCLNGGPQFKFSEAISLMAMCDDQDEIDEYWEKLSQGGEKSVCGWLKDKYGLSWQIVPADFDEWMKDKDESKKERVMAAVMKMTKLDIKTLEDAYHDKVGVR